jgi:outer membrane protein OmpA-like peptidoglycan-associated protein
MQWLISKGIAKERLTAKGFGETQLVNKCADGVVCNETEHQLNRRSQFVITAL